MFLFVGVFGYEDIGHLGQERGDDGAILDGERHAFAAAIRRQRVQCRARHSAPVGRQLPGAVRAVPTEEVDLLLAAPRVGPHPVVVHGEDHVVTPDFEAFAQCRCTPLCLCAVAPRGPDLAGIDGDGVGARAELDRAEIHDRPVAGDRTPPHAFDVGVAVELPVQAHVQFAIVVLREQAQFQGVIPRLGDLDGEVQGRRILHAHRARFDRRIPCPIDDDEVLGFEDGLLALGTGEDGFVEVPAEVWRSTEAHIAFAHVVEFLDAHQVEVVDEVGPVSPKRVARAWDVELVLAGPDADVRRFEARHLLAARLARQQGGVVLAHARQVARRTGDRRDVEGAGRAKDLLDQRRARAAGDHAVVVGGDAAAVQPDVTGTRQTLRVGAEKAAITLGAQIGAFAVQIIGDGPHAFDLRLLTATQRSVGKPGRKIAPAGVEHVEIQHGRRKRQFRIEAVDHLLRQPAVP